MYHFSIYPADERKISWASEAAGNEVIKRAKGVAGT